MPGIGPLALRAVQLQQITRTVTHRHRRVRHRLAEQMRKSLLALVIEMGLAPEENHLVLHQRLLDRLDHAGLQLAGKLDATDLGANTTGHRMNIQRVHNGFYSKCGIAHG